MLLILVLNHLKKANDDVIFDRTDDEDFWHVMILYISEF